jgi:hypothetical protein
MVSQVEVAERPAPLTRNPANGRYFVAADGRGVLLTGSHTWTTIQDVSASDPPLEFDFESFADRVAELGHTFSRLFAWEHARWAPWTTKDLRFAPLRYRRTGPGTAIDDGPRFDLSQFDDRYFQRLRDRVDALARRGLYASVMLFQGWSVEDKPFPLHEGRNPWDSHPFNPDNNINGIDGDPHNTGQGIAVHTLELPEINELNRSYIGRVVAAVGGCSNVLYEITNEDASTDLDQAWQEQMVETVRAAERAAGCDVHPVLISAQWPTRPDENRWLTGSAADAVSLSGTKWNLGVGDDYMVDVPASGGERVVLLDTDHLWGVGGDARWVWRAVTRGHNPIFMDPWDGDFVVHRPYNPDARLAMGIAGKLSREIDFAALEPRPQLASSGHALASADLATAVVLQETGDPLAVDLTAGAGPYRAEWWHTVAGARTTVPAVTGGEVVKLVPPYSGGAVLVLQIGAVDPRPTVGGDNA